MSEQTKILRDNIEHLIDKLELIEFKKDLLNNLKFNYSLTSYCDEDYSQLGNTRLGGLPDLPKDIDYPHNENGYYNLLCQINFSDFKEKLGTLPDKGILYVFNGHASENDFVTIFTETTERLVRKEPPQGLENLNNEIRKRPYDGLKANFEIGYYFSGDTSKIYYHDAEKYHSLMKFNNSNKTFILGKAPDACSIYTYLKGFDTLMHEVLLYKGIREDYQSQLKIYLQECNDEKP